MKNPKSKFQNYKNEELTKSQLKSVRGGDGDPTPIPNPPVDPGKGGGAGNG